MSSENASRDLAGRPTDEAVAAVLDREDESDPGAVRETLARVSEDGVVTESAVEDALAHVSKVVATPENRLEMAELECESAVEDAEPVSDLGAVRSRLDTYAARLADLQGRTTALVADLRRLVEREERAVYATASEIDRLTNAANRAQRDADALKNDVEEFRRWLDDPERRSRTLGEEVDLLADSLDDLDATLDGLDDGSDWFRVARRRRVLTLLAADLRAELVDLRAWGEREGLDGDPFADAAARLEDLEERLAATGDRVEERARPAWRDRFGERLAAADETLDEFEPPVSWGAVRDAIDDHRAAPDAGATE